MGSISDNSPTYEAYKHLSVDLMHLFTYHSSYFDNIILKYNIRPSVFITPNYYKSIIDGINSSLLGRQFIFTVLSTNFTTMADSIDDCVRLIEADEEPSVEDIELDFRERLLNDLLKDTKLKTHLLS